ncbi:hypothetical protein GGU10DRAFT_401828 [Lentinula aff. detonsa]|uniref:Uncharacterized protein n=1 Tax=Lentinula aff. detonsa TaxID=2804958 RepID=A0AA38KKJ4_9AGAR|nr:hypothetical protein GGU10DRAFT_401828 [Lentinula aff. detonsa]
MNSPNSEDSWIPLSDIPDSFNELIDKFHHRHPRSPRPPQFILDFARRAPLDSTSHNSDSTSPSVLSHRPAIPPAIRRPRSPSAVHHDPRTNYVPPAQTTTRSGCISKPPQRLDPIS